MSHAHGQCRFPDGTVKFFEYNGTGNTCMRQLRNSREEVVDHWREANWAECTCGRDEPVTLACDYADGSHWPGRACLHCMAISFDSEADFDEATGDQSKDGLPPWWIQ